MQVKKVGSKVGHAAGAVGSSPVLIVGVAGAALVAGVYFMSQNRPTPVVDGGSMPFSFDALANWLDGRNGGPGGGSGGPVPINPLPCLPGYVRNNNGACVPGNPIGPDPQEPGSPPHPGPEPIECAGGYHFDPILGRCVPDGGFSPPTGGDPPIWGDDAVIQPPMLDLGKRSRNPYNIHEDSTEGDGAPALGVGGGKPRIVGFSLNNLFTQRWNLSHALQKLNRGEELINGGK